ncbi:MULTISPECIES: hybrid sensor histidine kinase/response regulator [Cyanophyceae]|uniref:hybrid sensor histidine kinase/response regulator n=1 Tax=Cyanophyceae TaxID=3028117 RepID=UPI0016843F06|nr:response regulator [Trichocoleus sp. FACHB-69]MBD1931527.1 response regulator [Trichocoleus sp. FACHB-69]
MAIDSDIRDQAYQFFIQEASELLQLIEAELLTLKTERSTPKVHNLMRAAHSIKGGAACVGLETIKILAHRLEDFFKALYNEEIQIDDELETLLLQAYDCLRLPLMDEITTGYFNPEQAMAIAEPVFAQIEGQLGDFLGGEDPILNPVELGIDITLSIFEVDVAQELDRLTNVVIYPEGNEVAGELRAIADVFTGIAELLNLPGFGAIAQTTIAALNAHPEQTLQIAQLALADFKAGREAVLAGDRAEGGVPSPALAQLAVPTPTVLTVAELLTQEKTTEAIPSVDELFGIFDLTSQTKELTTRSNIDVSDTISVTSPEEVHAIVLVPQEEEILTPILSVDEILALSASPPKTTEISQVSKSSKSDWSAVLSTEDNFLGSDLLIQEETIDFTYSLEELIDDFLSSQQSPENSNLLEVEELELMTIATEEVSESDLIIQKSIFDEVHCLEEYLINGFSELPNTEIADIVGVKTSNDITTEEQITKIELAKEETELVRIPPLPATPVSTPPQELYSDLVEAPSPDKIKNLVKSIEQVFDSLPLVEEFPATYIAQKDSLKEVSNITTPNSELGDTANNQKSNLPVLPLTKSARQNPKTILEPAVQENNEATSSPTNPTHHLSVRVDLDRLERMNNLVGELSINRNSLSLQNEQLQGTVQELLRRLGKFQELANHLRDLSDEMLVAPSRVLLAERHEVRDQTRKLTQGKKDLSLNFKISGEGKESLLSNASSLNGGNPPTRLAPQDALRAEELTTLSTQTEFDSLEMDSYGELHSLLQDTLEEMAQLEEIVGDVALLAGQSSQTIESQRQMVTHLRDDLMWARMLPLGEVLTRYPRTLRDLSTTYDKPVDLKLSGTGVLVDKAVLEKLYDPLLHLLRNAFDHGIEPPEVRRQQKKPERGQIEIRAYHQGSQTVIEVRDDGQGINLERIRNRAVDLGLLSSKQLATTPTDQLFDLLYEPGFSTATQVSELSGRGVGLDVVRSQLRSLKGTVTVTSTLGRGTTFTLRIPLTLTIAKLLVGLVGSTAYALPSDSIEEILIPKSDQVKRSGKQRFLHWRKRIVPVYHLSELLDYAVPLPESIPSQALVAVPSPEDWASPMLLLRQDNQFLALEIDRLVTEQELVIKPFGGAIAPPSYIYGCTILGDGSLIPVIDGATLINQFIGQGQNALVTTTLPDLPASTPIKTALTDKTKVSTNTAKSPLVLIVDDSIALRQTLALTLQKVGYRVLQARDGREAIEHLQQNSSIQMVVCDIEMPNMNGFEFLNHRRQEPLLSKIPVIMLTSRSSDKHRQLAAHLGASAYFTKPYLDQEFLAAIKTLIDKEGSR